MIEALATTDPSNEEAAVQRLRAVCIHFGWPIELAITHLLATSLDLSVHHYGPVTTKLWFNTVVEDLDKTLAKRQDARVH
ncbi:MAG: hypothetical protein JW395_3380 [Nitrospira sp.]|nr:hypothetical protein [Nitrospira sp.]